ncbi:hypothetical protein CDAR_251621 [Caerostris darwini]|uniref:Uncharacterized protein n=1 Tax=Caerostris darwini TaxID=1538125 RepID=A0AAV4R980_9ARAC|nr:hypothetical protein CDAR_251621 [Caerostris darwini]
MYKQKLEKPIILLTIKSEKGVDGWSDKCRKAIFYACRKVQSSRHIKETASATRIVISLHLPQLQRCRILSDTVVNSYKGTRSITVTQKKRAYSKRVVRKCLLNAMCQCAKAIRIMKVKFMYLHFQELKMKGRDGFKPSRGRTLPTEKIP